MVFGFFTKKTTAPAVPPESVPLPESPPPNTSTRPGGSIGLQLRTPSPSVDSRSVANGAPHSNASPAPTLSNSSSGSARPVSPALPEGTSKDVEDNILPPLEPTPEALSERIQSIPAKILHAYTLSRIPLASSETLKELAVFFDSLYPPPSLHCVRCHKDYVEVENDDRSCLVPHDDESAEVERVGRNKKEGRRTVEGAEYETLWGCCGKVTEGNGDQGPPDGWCYEGKHTTDIKRAKFRADATPQDDKLVSCLRLNCHGIRSTLPRSSTRKRARPAANYKEVSSDEDEGLSDGEPDSGVEEITGTRMPRKRKPVTKNKGKGKGKAKEVDGDKMDVDGEDPEKDNEDERDEEGDAGSISRAGSVRGRSDRGSNAGAAVLSTPSTGPRRRGRPPKAKKQETAEDPDGDGAASDNVNNYAQTPSQAPPSTNAKRRGRPPKSKAYISDSDHAASGNERGRSAALTPGKKRGRDLERPDTSASPSRRVEPPRSTGSPRAKPLSKSGLQQGVGLGKEPSSTVVPETDDERDVDNSKPRKKRRVVS
ncbi:hypothetical protein K474DRAFT_1686404 [Panus rudis PR-1116 ss-1]|nr:hypothetical protein K474DRAFT_1686404 [Panus rudis PR-1116 ss-1]